MWGNGQRQPRHRRRNKSVSDWEREIEREREGGEKAWEDWQFTERVIKSTTMATIYIQTCIGGIWV